MAIEFLDFLVAPKEEKPKENDLQLDEVERLFYLLNGQPNFYFRFPYPEDLRTILCKFKEEECIVRLESRVKTIVGNANGVLKVQSIVNAPFNNHEFLKEKMVSRQFLLDVLPFPDNLPRDKEGEAMREYERTIRLNPLIRRKKSLLESIGYTYMIHYDAVKLSNQVIEDVRKTSG